MGNRHHNKKLRIAVRATMAKTGESYQQVLARLRNERTERARDVDLIAIQYFGTELTLATFEILGAVSCIVTPGCHWAQPYPDNPLLALARPRGLG